ncbi:hypothetical protein [Nostoc sp.]|uniref:hypothetical protein n=1 Tax=Nostoc sp. TaxID=1180 RepID=UPI0035934C27
MISYYLILTIPFLLLNACELAKTQDQDFPLPNPSQQSSASQESSSDACSNVKRLLNPDAELTSSETELDRYFRLAFDAETEGHFEEASSFYQKAAEIATCECDQQHALAGKQAAQEAKDLVSHQGMASKPTQFFWARLQELTRSLPCVQIQE